MDLLQLLTAGLPVSNFAQTARLLAGTVLQLVGSIDTQLGGQNHEDPLHSGFIDARRHRRRRRRGSRPARSSKTAPCSLLRVDGT